jgi:hypothetical protein
VISCDHLKLLSVSFQASSKSAASGLVTYKLPERGCDSVKGSLVAPTGDQVSEEVLDLRDLLVEMFPTFGEGERDFPLIGGGWDTLDKISFDQAIDQSTGTASFADEPLPNFDQGKRLSFVKDRQCFGLGRGETQWANLLSEETRPLTLCCQDQVT